MWFGNSPLKGEYERSEGKSDVAVETEEDGVEIDFSAEMNKASDFR